MTANNHLSWVKSTCAYCGVGCGIETRITSDGLLDVRGDKQHPANYGRLCSKGLTLGETLVNDIVNTSRLLHPRVNGIRATWDDALSRVASRLTSSITEHGPDSVAFYVSGQLLTEDYYVANKLMKGFIGSANIDTNSRLCMSSSVAGHIRAFGSDTVPGCYEDLELADLVVLIGSNLAWCHPVLYQRLKSAKQRRPQMRLVVIDPRRTDSCDIADLHLAITPGMDVALLNELLVYLVKQDAIDRRYIETNTENFLDALQTALHEFADITHLAAKVGVNVNDITHFFELFAACDKTVSLYSQGVNQSIAGTDKVNSIINCHLATGRIGKPGAGPFSITGQPNAMGGREVGGLANTLAAHMGFDNPDNLRRIQTFWQAEKMATKPGLKAVDLFDAVADGTIKCIWIMATNPAVSMPNVGKIKRALELCPTVIVSDCIADTDTTRCANIVLPAMGWAEKSGTVTNSERRISRQRALIASTAEARPDWWIITEVARRMGFGSAFPYRSEHEIFKEYAALTGTDNHGTRDLDISGFANISKAEYDAMQPTQWPFSAAHRQGMKAESRRLFADGKFFTPSGKARFVATAWRAPAMMASAQFPLILNTGRIRDQWHTMTRTALVPRLNTHRPEPFMAIHPHDAETHGLVNKTLADIRSARGHARVRVEVTSETPQGQVFMPIHWSGVNASHSVAGNLIEPYIDEVSGQPELKHTPVSVRPWAYASDARLVSRVRLNGRLASMGICGYWAEQRISGGYAYYAASQHEPAALQKHLMALRPDGIALELLDFSDATSGQYRMAVGNSDQLLFAAMVAKALQESDLEWLTMLFKEDLSLDSRRAIIRGGVPASSAAGKIICACHQVGLNRIHTAIRVGELSTAAAIGTATGAGTGCGSCVAELNRILAREHSALSPL